MDSHYPTWSMTAQPLTLLSAASTFRDNEDMSSTAAQIDGPSRSWESLFGPSIPDYVSNNNEGSEKDNTPPEQLTQLQRPTNQHIQHTEPTPPPTPPPLDTEEIVKPFEGCQFYQFRENGEKLTLIVGEDERTKITIIVSPDVVRNLSKKWETLVDKSKQRIRSKPWQPSSLSRKHAKGRREIVLPNADPVMMVQVMKIAHYDFNGLFATLNFQQTLATALISYNFQTNRLLIPFLANWAVSHKENVLQPGYEEWLFVAWQFGFEDDYLKLSKYLAIHCRVDIDGQLLNLAGDNILAGHFPEDALDYICAIRLRTLQSFLDTIYLHTDHMINANTCVATDSPTTTLSDSERTECTLLNYGSMIRQLRVLGFWPQTYNPADVLRAAAITDSLAEVAEKLTNLQVLTWRQNRNDGLENNGVERHRECDSGKLLANKISAILARMEDCISNDTRDGLRKNAGTCQVL